MIHWGKCLILTFLSILQYVDEKDIFFICKNRPNCLLWKIKEKICSKKISPPHPLLGPDLFNTCIRATLEGWNALTKKGKKHPSRIIVDVREDLYKTQLLIKKTTRLDYIFVLARNHVFMFPKVPLHNIGLSGYFSVPLNHTLNGEAQHKRRS